MDLNQLLEKHLKKNENLKRIATLVISQYKSIKIKHVKRHPKLNRFKLSD